MKEIKVCVREDVCQAVKVKIDNVLCRVYENLDMRLCGSLQANKGYKLQGKYLQVRVDFFNQEHQMLYTMHDYEERKKTWIGMGSFELSCVKFDRFVGDVEDICQAEIYPYFVG